MHHGDWKMTMTTLAGPALDGAPAPLKPAPLLGEHTAEALGDWLGLSAEQVGGATRGGSCLRGSCLTG